MVTGPVPEPASVVYLEGHCLGCNRELKPGDIVVRFPTLTILAIDGPIIATIDSHTEYMLHADCFRVNMTVTLK